MRQWSAAAVALAVVVGLVITSPASAAPSVAAGGTPSSLTITPDLVTAGTIALGEVTLTATVSTSTVVALSSTDTTVLTVPASVTVPGGALSATFPVTTIPFVGPGTFACVNATANGVNVVDCLNINPTPSGPVLVSMTFSPATVVGGSPATGTVRFGSVTDGAVVSLVSGNPAIVSVPTETVVSGGQASGAFPVTTSAVIAAATVTVTASAFGTTVTGTLTVTPGTPPPADIVRIRRATWKAGLLRIEATSTNPNAILGVYLTASNSFMFNLDNDGNGRYSARRPWVFNPLNITVRSNFGGSASASTA